jgi:hypothetical protein
MMPYATALINFKKHQRRLRMQQFDFTLLFIWYAVPFALLGLRAAHAGYKAWKKKSELRRLEKTVTPFTRKI